MIDDDMKFFNFENFYKKAEYIKCRYTKMSLREQQIYKMYVYSNRIIKESLADKIWEYLNEPFGSCYYVSREMLGVYLKEVD